MIEVYNKYLDSLSPLLAGKINKHMLTKLRFNGEYVTTLDWTILLYNDGYIAEVRDVPKYKFDRIKDFKGTLKDKDWSLQKLQYSMYKDNNGYKISKTQFDFLEYYNEYISMMSMTAEDCEMINSLFILK